MANTIETMKRTFLSEERLAAVDEPRKLEIKESGSDALASIASKIIENIPGIIMGGESQGRVD